MLLFSWTITSNAQYISKNTKQPEIIAPFVKILSDYLSKEQSEFSNPTMRLTKENTYLNTNLFFFEENIQICKDILTETTKDKSTNIDFSTKEDQTSNDSVLFQKQPVLREKQEYKSIWNHPGNSNTGI